MSRDNRYLLAADSGMDHVNVYELNQITGKLKQIDIIRSDVGSGPKHMVFSKDGQFLYIVHEIKNYIDVYNYKFVEKYEVPSQEKIDRQVDSVLCTLTTREKIAQLMVIDMTSMDSKEEYRIQKRLVRKEKVGGLIPLGYDDYKSAVKKINRLNRLAKIPMLMTIDGEWGVSMRWKGVPGYHTFLQMGALGSDSLV